jgi:conjugal transfer pilus assembly protein TrbC
MHGNDKMTGQGRNIWLTVLLIMSSVLFCLPLWAKAEETPLARSHLLIFVSSSMPTESLVQWLQEAQTLQAPVLLRGVVNQSLANTLTWIQPLLAQAGNGGGIAIDPVAFETYGITTVPAVVISDDPAACYSNALCKAPPFDVVAGNSSLKAACEIIADKGSVGKGYAKAALIRLRAGS